MTIYNSIKGTHMKTFSTILLTLACVVLTSTTVMGQTTVGPNNAGTGANVASVGTVAWTNPGNALTNNNSYATVTLASQTSNYLQTTNYGFAIPTDATINGIQATIGRFENTTGTGNDVRDNVVQLIKAGALVGSNYAVTGTDWPTSETAVNYGGTADLWGATWTPAEVNATNFGVALSANSTNSRTASVDYMTISVTYTPAPQTYTWNGGASASWATAASWSPSRTMPATTDILQFNGGGSVTATSVPTQTIGRLVISGNITLTLQSAASVTLTIGGGTGDDLVVESGSSLAQGTTVNLTLGSSTTANIAGTLTINSGCTYNTDGTSVVTTVTGTVVNSGTLTNATASKLLLQNGSTFQHNINNFTWPTATWDPGATFAITGLGTNSQSNPYPSFPTGVKNLIWDCPNQNFSNAIAHSGTLTVDNLTIRNTGTNATTGQFRVQTSPITVNNDLNISGGVLWIAGLGTKTLNVGRDLNMSGGELDVCTGTTASYTGIVNITRNLSLSNNAILDLSDSTSVALGTVNLQGNFTQSGTSVLRTSTTGTGSGVFNFSGTSAQTFSKSGGTIACATSGDSLSFIIDNNAIVDFGTSVLDNVAGSGSVRFTIAAGATMTIGSPDGISSSGATGTIQVTGTRRYNSGANYIYKNLTPTAQVTGNALPTSVNNLTVNNSAGVTLTADETISGTLTLTSGNVTTGASSLIIGSSGTVSRTSGHIIGNLRKNVATGATTRTFEVGTASGYNPVSVTFGSVSAAGNLTAKANAGDHVSLGSSTLDVAKSVNANWTLTKDGSLTFNNYTVVFNFNNPADLDGSVNTSSLIVGKYNAPTWTYPTVGTRIATSTQATGITSFSDFALAELAAAGPPAAPTALAATNVAQTQFQANWNSVSGATGYRLDVSTATDFSSYVSGYQDKPVAGTDDVVTGLTANTAYHYRVRAENGAGTSGNSGTIDVTTLVNVPAAPTALPATNIAQTQFQANWNSVSGATGYRLDVSAASTFSTYVSGYQNKAVDGTNDIVTGLTAGTAYHYRVRAENAGGASGNSDTIDVTTLAIVPGAPVATAATSVTQTSFQANWNASSGATSYRLDVATDVGFTALLTGYNDLTVAGMSQSVTGLTAGTPYYYRVRAVNTGGTSENSNTITATTLGFKTWTGGTGTGKNWTTGSNWSGGTAPLAGEDILFNTAGTITFSTMPASVSYNSLTISQGSVTLIHTSSITLTLGGNVSTDFTVASGASLLLGTNVSVTLATSATANIGGTLTVNASRTYNTDGTSVVTTVTGSIVNSGTVTCTSGSKLLFQGGSVYEHAQNDGTVPTATWNATSTCLVTGIVATYPTFADNQTLGNLTWNCTGQTAVGPITNNPPPAIAGNLTVQSTNTGSLRFQYGPVNITGNLVITDGVLWVAGSNGKDFVVGGNVTMSGDSLQLSGGSTRGTVSVAGNFSHTAGVIAATGTGGSNELIFNGSGDQTLTSTGGTVTSRVNFTINKSTGAVVLGSNMTFPDTLRLTSGNINTSSYILTIADSSNHVVRTSGHVVGNLSKRVATGATSRTFEV
ncbi:MAG TPA: hypothetical protein DGH68_06795, partial [Bacteroidetes bacterium]|nr:hypothetical protein [Bacteroidota bacterium]